MKQYFIFFFFTILIVSCIDKKPKFNPEAIKLNNQACELMKKQLYDSALVLLDKATAIDKKLSNAYANKIEIYCQRKEFKKATIEAENQLKAKPDLAEGWTFTGMLLDRQGDTIEAKKYYKKSIEIYDSRIKNPDQKKFIVNNKLNKAISLILLRHELEGRNELKKLKEEYPNQMNIDSLLNMTRLEIINNVFKNN